MIIKQVIGAVSMDKLAACFKVGGVPIDSSRTDYGKVFCNKPFVDKKTLAARICPSAVGFVKPVKGNFAAESVGGAVESAPAPTPTPTPAQPVNVESVQASSTQQDAPAFKFCFKCGNKIGADDLFCAKCGTRQ